MSDQVNISPPQTGVSDFNPWINYLNTDAVNTSKWPRATGSQCGGMEEDTDEQNSQGNKLALKQMSLRKAIRVHSPLCFQRKKY